MKRVVITGVGAVPAFGKTWEEVKAAFQRKQNAVQAKTEWAERYPELGANLGAEKSMITPLLPIGIENNFAVWVVSLSICCWEAAELALANANLLDENGNHFTLFKRRNNGCRLWLFYWLNK